ncbi:hypothetical protein [Mycobacterium paraintracellulare]
MPEKDVIFQPVCICRDFSLTWEIGAPNRRIRISSSWLPVEAGPL